MIKSEYKKILVEATKRFWEKGLSPGMDSGDLSIRDVQTGYIYICPRPSETLEILNWGDICESDIAVIDIDGNYVEDTGVLATVEAPMHLSIYLKRTEVNAIIHSHAVWSSAFAITGKNIPSTLAEQSIHLGGEVVCAEYGKVGSQKLAENIVEALGEKRYAALLRNHGAVVVGEDIEHALTLSDFLEKSAKTVLLGRVLGEVIEIKEDDILDESLLKDH